MAANSGAARSAQLTVGERELRVEQGPAPCTYTVTPDRFTLSYKKQSRKIEVATPSHCQWSATVSARWLRVSTDPHTGSGELEVKIEENSRSDARFAVVIVAGENFSKEVTIAQAEEDD